MAEHRLSMHQITGTIPAHTTVTLISPGKKECTITLALVRELNKITTRVRIGKERSDPKPWVGSTGQGKGPFC